MSHDCKHNRLKQSIVEGARKLGKNFCTQCGKWVNIESLPRCRNCHKLVIHEDDHQINLHLPSGQYRQWSCEKGVC